MFNGMLILPKIKDGGPPLPATTSFVSLTSKIRGFIRPLSTSSAAGLGFVLENKRLPHKREVYFMNMWT